MATTWGGDGLLLQLEKLTGNIKKETLGCGVVLSTKMFYISRDEVYVGTTLVSQALSAGRVSPMLAASKKYIPLDPASSTVIRTG